MKKFEIIRGGFLRYKVWGPNHCGMENYLEGGKIAVKYKVRLLATGSLDEKGFLIDNMFISNWMKQAAFQGSDLSCELLLEALCQDLHTAMRVAEPSLHILAFSMELSPDFGNGEEATMRYFYDTEEEPSSGGRNQVLAALDREVASLR